MRLDRFLAKSRIIDLQSEDFKSAISELVDLCPIDESVEMEKSVILRELISREKKMTTCLGNDIAMPHMRVPMKRSYIFAIGRCRAGLEFDGQVEYKELRLIFLLLAGEGEKSYLKILASLARIFQDKVLVDKLVSARNLKELREEVTVAFGGTPSKTAKRGSKFNKLVIREMVKIAHGVKCSALVIFGETMEGPLELGEAIRDFKTVLVTSTAAEVSDHEDVDEVLSVPSFSSTRLSQLRSAILIGLTRGVFKYNDRLCCLGGKPRSNQFDSIVIVDVEREFQSVFTKQADMLPSSVKPEVVERVLAISMEMAVEGREGKPIGTLFVIGDTDRVRPFTKPLILNPFYGYKLEDRNILNPFMDETVKELSLMDGAFLIRGDGVLDTAGALIHAPEYNHQLPGGLGARHAAGAAISMATDCISLVISSSGQITLFRRGEMLPLMGKQGALGM